MRRYVAGNNKMERPLHNFLNRLAKQAVKDFVIGNSSADYDSFFGSIIFAYFLTSTTGRLHMPIIDCPQDQVACRFEIKSVLDKLSINTSSLLFRQSPQAAYPLGTYNLYDHNFRSNLDHEVQYIVDHHQQKSVKGRKQLINTMGSVLTMLFYLLAPARMPKEDQHGFQAKYYEFIQGECFQSVKSEAIDDEIKQIILYGIMIDTFNLDQKQRKRWTIFDQHAVQTISSDLSKQDIWSYDTLMKKKSDVQESKKLSLKQHLGKDRKEQHYGELTCFYSAVLISLVDFYQHYQLQTSFASSTHPFDLYFIMAVFENQQGETERELIFKVSNPDGKRIQAAINNCLVGLAFQDMGQLGEWKRWRDPSRTISRKVLEPMIRKECMQLNIQKMAQL